MAKDGKFTWPREAAAKAGRVRQLADEETAFRLKLRNLSPDGNLLAGEPPMLGKSVDAMDISGRWYKREILEVDTQDGTSPKKSQVCQITSEQNVQRGMQEETHIENTVSRAGGILAGPTFSEQLARPICSPSADYRTQDDGE